MSNPEGSTDTFRCAFPQKILSVRLSCGINYTDLHWQRFCGRIGQQRTFAREEILCLSRKGRAVPLLRVGRLDGTAKFRMVLTARHHACETMANFVIEGVVLAMRAGDETGAWFRENVELVTLPFMDRDGVEDGDPGKSRQPHDHNRDYGENNIYPETRALREYILRWADHRLAFMADLHCPWIRGNSHEQIYQVSKLDPTLWAEQRYFGEMLVNAIRGPLPFQNVDYQFFGDEWQATAGQTSGVCPADGFAKIPGMRLATSFEIPYANSSGVHVTAEGVRSFGNDLARAIRQYLADEDTAPVEEIADAATDDVPLAKIYIDPENPHPAPASSHSHAKAAQVPAQPAPTTPRVATAKLAEQGTPTGNTG